MGASGLAQSAQLALCLKEQAQDCGVPSPALQTARKTDEKHGESSHREKSGGPRDQGSWCLTTAFSGPQETASAQGI